MDHENPKCYMRNQSFILYGSIFCFVIPLLIMKLTFSLTVRKLRMQIDKLSTTANTLIAQSVENKFDNDSLHPKTIKNSIKKSPTEIPYYLRRNKSNRVKTKPTMSTGQSNTTESIKTELKAMKVLGIVFIAFIIAWLPLCLINIITVLFQTSYLNEFLSPFTYLGYISSTFNPIIYTAFNKRFRKNFFEILRCSGKKKGNLFLIRG